MSYQVLARKWRPRDFSQMVGQEHVLQALINALDHDRLHHAFLFTGTRGVGKTTIARILAKSLNCLEGVGSKPCGLCSACTEIDEGRFVDLIEVDAASRTGVDDTRELLENVQYSPTRGRYKVYLIDEVHMLSKSSFNALLKTLEEPPPHVKFLLATTDPQKIPVTVLSRCLQFNLKRLPLASIRDRISLVLDAEKIEADADAIEGLARAADGSLRDALSLLDQAIAFGGGEVRAEPTGRMLGTLERDQTRGLIEALLAQDGPRIMSLIAKLDEQAPDYHRALGDLASLIQRIAIAQMVPEPEEDERGDREFVRDMAASWRAEELQLLYQITLIGRRDLSLAPDPRAGFEMNLLRMMHFRPGVRIAVPPAGAAPVAASATQRDADAGQGSSLAQGAVERESAAPVDVAPQAESAPAPAPASGASGEWPAMTAALSIRGGVRELAENCELLELSDGRVSLRLDARSAFLATSDSEARLKEALSEHLGTSVKLTLKAGEIEGETVAMRRERADAELRRQAEESVRNDPNVQALQDQLGGQVLYDAVRPVGKDH
jgi:DNA polymerase-3 subunit gamma/tau